MTKTEGVPNSDAIELSTHDRRARLRLIAATWIPVAAAAVLAVFIGVQIYRDQLTLSDLRNQVTEAESRLAEKERDAEEAAAEVEQLEERAATLQSTIDGLEERQRALKIEVESTDPEVVIAKVREQLGGRTREEVADSLWRRGQDAFAAGKLPLADRLYDAASKEDPTFAAPLNGLGRVAAERKEFMVAEKFYRKAIAADPKRAPAYFNLANLNLMRGRFDDARAYAEKTLSVDPNYADAKALLKRLETTTAPRP